MVVFDESPTAKEQDAGAYLDYWLCFVDLVGADLIIDFVISNPSGITVSLAAVNDAVLVDDDLRSHPAGTVIKFWLSGGVVGESYNVNARYTTAIGRIDERSITIYCVEK